MLDKVIKTIRKYNMLEDVSEVTVALSGGADSVCLLHILAGIQNLFKFRLSAVHINHQLRGSESDRDEQFVTELCSRLNIPLITERVNVKEYAALNRESIELSARNLRYSIFESVNKGVIATAHTASDNLETFLFNSARGAGLKGICGIPPKRDIFIRPLIAVTRDEVEEYLAENKLSFVTDSTNNSDDYSRNKIRHNAVPVLKEINQSAEVSVARLTAALREDEDFISITAYKIYLLCKKEDYLDAELLRIQHPAIIKRVISLFVYENKGINLDSAHMENCLELLVNSGKTGLFSNIYAFCDNNRFYLLEFDKSEPQFTYKTEIKGKVNNLLSNNTIDCDKISGKLVLRTRIESDKIRLAGRNCTKTLKKLFSELKIPENERDIIPVAADDLGVVWIYNIGVSERVKANSKTVNAIEFETVKINKL